MKRRPQHLKHLTNHHDENLSNNISYNNYSHNINNIHHLVAETSSPVDDNIIEADLHNDDSSMSWLLNNGSGSSSVATIRGRKAQQRASSVNSGVVHPHHQSIHNHASNLLSPTLVSNGASMVTLTLDEEALREDLHDLYERPSSKLSNAFHPSSSRKATSIKSMSINANILTGIETRKPSITKGSVKTRHGYEMPSSPYSVTRYQQPQQFTTLSPSSSIPPSPHNGQRRTPRSPSPSLFFHPSSPQVSSSRHSSKMYPMSNKTSNMISVVGSPMSAHTPHHQQIIPLNISPRSSTPTSGGGSPHSDHSRTPPTPRTPRTPITPRGTLPMLTKHTRSNNDSPSESDHGSSGSRTPVLLASPTNSDSALNDRSESESEKGRREKKRSSSRSTRERSTSYPSMSSSRRVECTDERVNSAKSNVSSTSRPESQEHSGESDPGTPNEVQKEKKRRKSIKNYKKGDLIGHGANGKVYMSFDADNCQFFAVKEVTFANVPPQILEEKLNALQREITLMKSLKHINIVQYYGAEKLGATLDIFLEYVPGGSIASLIKRFGRLSEDIVKQFTKQILIGLLYLHENRIVHRDIKGANILINVEGVIKLADFGASKKIQDIMTMSTDFKSLIGTPNFMAPEVITQEGHGRPADIWSIGCTVLEMFTGKPPFSECTTAAAVMFKIASTNDPPMFADCISEKAKDFLRNCFERDQSKRYTTFQLLQHPWLRDVEVPIHGKGPMSTSLTPRSAKKLSSPTHDPRTQSVPVHPKRMVAPLTLTTPNEDITDTKHLGRSDDVDIQPVPSPQPILPTRPRRRSFKTRYQTEEEASIPYRERSNTPDFFAERDRREDNVNLQSTEALFTKEKQSHMKPPRIVLEEEPKEGYDSRKSIREFLRGAYERSATTLSG